MVEGFWERERKMGIDRLIVEKKRERRERVCDSDIEIGERPKSRDGRTKKESERDGMQR